MHDAGIVGPLGAIARLLVDPDVHGRGILPERCCRRLGTGIGDVGWQDIEILRSESGAPVLILHGYAEKLAADLGLKTWSISLSHTREHAMAMVVATSE